MSESQHWWQGRRGEWYVVAQLVVLALVIFGPRTWQGAPEWSAQAARAATPVGIALVLAGAALALYGSLSLGPALTPLPFPTENALLVEYGPYAIVRHPIYTGLVLFTLGLGLWLHSWLTLLYAAALFILFDLKSRREERWLIERFPEYAEYQKRIKRLVPWLY